MKDVSEYYKQDLMYFHRNVRNLARSREFYENILELQLFADNQDHKWCSFKLPLKGLLLSLSEVDIENNPKESVDGLEFSVNDLEALHTKFNKMSQNISQIIDLPGILSMFHIYDPENNVISFIGEARK